MFIAYSMWTYLFAETSFRKCFDWFYIYNATYSVEVCRTLDHDAFKERMKDACKKSFKERKGEF